MSVYTWVLDLHLAGVGAFLLLHGPSVAVTFAVRNQRDARRLETLVDLSKFWVRLSFIPLLVVLASGIALGFLGSWWGWGWIWTAIVLLVAVMVLMNIRGTKKFYGIRRALGQEYPSGIRLVHGTGICLPEAELQAHARAVRPWELTAIGVAFLVLTVVLMVWKPF